MWWWWNRRKPSPPTPQPPPKPPPKPPLPPDGSSLRFQELMLQLHNDVRNSAGVPSLKLNPACITAAEGQAAYQASITRVTHSGRNGADLSKRMSAAGYGSFSSIAENVAGWSRDERAVVADWVNSRGHYANIVGRAYSDVGFGMSVGADGKKYWAAVFGSPGRGAVRLFLSGPLTGEPI